ncbi:hypothetical protein [Pedobacter sp. R-06]|uniref:hypothetical protein n=1 Tax=Pedobacter sp. R-06 TaxID=3404051 RepID=UPI003CF36C82
MNSYYQRLLDRIRTKNFIIMVPVQPENDAQLNNCFQNVAKKVAESGGSVCYGWAVLPQTHMLEAEKHAIWQSPEGEYIDITPRSFPVSVMQFLIDDEFQYKGQIVGNIRINVSGNKVVDDWIFVCEAIDVIYSDYADRIDEHRVTIPQEIAPFLQGLENFVKVYQPFITAGGTSETVCFCGKPLFYKDCHGNGIQDAIAKDLAQFAILLRTEGL